MLDQDTKKPNSKDELSQLKSLTQGAEDMGFSVDDILAEYGTRRSTERSAVPVQPDLPWPQAKPGPKERGKLVQFPGAAPADPGSPPQEDAPPEDELPEEDASAGQEEDGPAVVSFPEEETVLSAFVKDVARKGDEYADHMFEQAEQTDQEEVRRLEELIPGTDREEEPEEEPPPRPRRQEPPPPDTPPQELAKRFSRGLKAARVRVVLLALLCIPALAQLLVPALGLVWLPPLDEYAIQVWIAAGLLGAGMLLSADLLLEGLLRALRGRFGMDTLLTLAAGTTLADALQLALTQDRDGQLPCCAVVLFALLFQLNGRYHKRCGQRLACRTAAGAAQPYRLTLDEGKWNGKHTYTKEYGPVDGFGSQIQMDDGAQRIYRVLCPLLALADVLLAAVASVGMGRPERLLWCLSCNFTVCAAFAGGLVYGRPFHLLSRRLALEGAALAGWPGAASAPRDSRVVVTDLDLFPPGYVTLNGFKVLGDFPRERVVSYTATLIRDSGCGLERPFYDLLRTQGGLYRKAEGLCCYEGGGLSAHIRGEQVLVGSAAFMKLMEIQLPPGLNVKSAVFCAIEGQLAGIFALNYDLPDTCFPAMDMLLREKVGPVLATRDFNLIPAMLRQRFHLAADRMDFPPVERRRELSAPDQPHSEVLTALLCREGLLPYAESIVAARRLRRAARKGALLCCAASALGLLLTYYLTAALAFGSLSPLNLLIYMLLWFVPAYLISDSAHRY